MEAHFQWSGRVAHMPKYHPLKRVFFGELNSESCSHDQPHLDNIDTDSWETLAQNKRLVKRSVYACEQEFIELKVDIRDMLENPTDPSQLYSCPTSSFRPQ